MTKANIAWQKIFYYLHHKTKVYISSLFKQLAPILSYQLWSLQHILNVYYTAYDYWTFADLLFKFYYYLYQPLADSYHISPTHPHLCQYFLRNIIFISEVNNNANKDAGYDKMPPKLVKMSHEDISSVLSSNSRSSYQGRNPVQLLEHLTFTCTKVVGSKPN